MPRDPRRTDADPASLADRVYRARLSEDNRQVRRASRLVALPLTLLGYLALGLIGWQLVLHARTLPVESQKTVAVDLLDAGEGETPAPALAPAPILAPPPGALEKADAPPPPLPANPEAVPENTPAELPTQDLSGVAFPSAPPGATEGTGAAPGEGAGTGSGTGTGSGQGPKVVEFEFSEVEVLFEPTVTSANYPSSAKSARIQGTVKVIVVVGTDGVPVSVQAVEGPPLLRAAAGAIALKYRFKPETENGVPVIARFQLSVKFRLN